MSLQQRYLAAAGEAPERAELGAAWRERQVHYAQARAQRAAVARFVRANPGRTFGIIALLGILTGLFVMRR